MDSRSTADGSRIVRLVHFSGGGKHGFPSGSGFLVAGNDSEDGARVGAERACDDTSDTKLLIEKLRLELPSQPPPRLTAQEESNEIEVQTIR
jgi:hypothetical protein